MTPRPTATVTQLLEAWNRGDRQARDDLVPLVYEELRKRAVAYLRRERPGHSLQPTALVNETCLRLLGQERTAWINRAQFFGVAAQIMRRVLVDCARERRAAKRARGVRVTLDESISATTPIDCELLMLDEALRALAQLDERQAQIVEMKYFGGLSEAQIASILSLSRATVTREWQSARAWLYRCLTTPARAPRRAPALPRDSRG